MSFEVAVQKWIHKKYDNSEFFCDVSGYCEECCKKGWCLDLKNHIDFYNETDPDGLEYADHPYFNPESII